MWCLREDLAILICQQVNRLPYPFHQEGPCVWTRTLQLHASHRGTSRVENVVRGQIQGKHMQRMDRPNELTMIDRCESINLSVSLMSNIL